MRANMGIFSGFAGKTMHSARWDHSVSTDGKRVAVVGTGSTGVQIVGAIAGSVDTLVHFQRTPQWICPLPNGTYSKLTRAVMRRSKLATLSSRPATTPPLSCPIGQGARAFPES